MVIFVPEFALTHDDENYNEWKIFLFEGRGIIVKEFWILSKEFIMVEMMINEEKSTKVVLFLMCML